MKNADFTMKQVRKVMQAVRPFPGPEPEKPKTAGKKPKPKPKPKTAGKKPAKKQKPNVPCACGSGKKYKKCCGSASALQ